MSLAGYRLQGQPPHKIRPEHLDRAAVVYVRQSTRQQVLEHSESARLQYALAGRAVALGWARSQVTVIDDDLGVSAATADSRKGFARLVTEVTMGRAGIVLGIEMSRLARTGRDWHQLLELCSLAGVLLADPDGVYDPGYYNDRLLLGLKGTMSEAELYLIRQRMLSGKLAKAERGELAVPLPIGYARRPSGEVVLDPDEQAQHVVRLVFSAFRRLGTLNSVLRYLVGERVQLPVRVHSGPSKGEPEWRRPTGRPSATGALCTRSTTGPAGDASTSPEPPSTTGSPARYWRPWRRPHWKSRWPPPPRPKTSGPCWTNSGASGSSAPATPPAAPAASTSSPSRRTGSWPGSWKRTGRPRSPRRPGWRRTTSGSPRNSRPSSARPSGRPSRPWPAISRRSGMHRPLHKPTARSCCASSSRTSP